MPLPQPNYEELLHRNELVPGKVKVSALPVVNQHRTALVFPFAPADVLPDDLMEIMAQLSKALGRAAQNHLRRIKTLARLQRPRKVVRMDAADQTGLIDLVFFCFH